MASSPKPMKQKKAPKAPKLPALRDRVKKPKLTRIPKPPKPPKIPRTVKRGSHDWSHHVPAIAIAVAIAGLSWLTSWWAVSLCAAVGAAVFRRREDIAMEAMWGAVGGWALLLVVDSLHGRTYALARAVGGVLYLPGVGFFLLTLLFAAGLGWSTATVVSSAARWRLTERK